ncbi:hypothetical protein ACLOJK_027931 [Asimina triloba]
MGGDNASPTATIVSRPGPDCLAVETTAATVFHRVYIAVLGMRKATDELRRSLWHLALSLHLVAFAKIAIFR